MSRARPSASCNQSRQHARDHRPAMRSSLSIHVAASYITEVSYPSWLHQRFTDTVHLASSHICIVV
eukprot:6208868-Pleurochrysis_carterae.AAC.3